MSISYTHEFVELHNKETNHSVIVREFTDFYFDHGYRFLRYVPCHEVDIFEVDEREDRLATWLLKNSSSDPMVYKEVLWETSGTSEGYYYQEPEIY